MATLAPIGDQAAFENHQNIVGTAVGAVHSPIVFPDAAQLRLRNLRARPLISRGWFQLFAGVLLSVVLPVFVRWVVVATSPGEQVAFHDFLLVGSSVGNSAIGTLISILSGYYFYRVLTQFPGSSTFPLIAPIFLASFLAVVITFFLLKLDYVRGQFMASFALSMIWFHFAHVCAARRHVRRIAVVPFGDVHGLINRDSVQWVPLARPSSAANRWSCIVVDLRARMPAEWERFIADQALAGIPIYHIKQIRESLDGKVAIEHLSENNFGSIVPGHAYLQIKLIADIALALAALVITMPLLAAIALLIRMDSPGPALFRQQRVGFRGRLFTMFKFRTMTHSSKVGDCTRLEAITLADDPRITRVGRFLRRTRLDELPQILNILLGQMSWIGPRPEASALSLWYEKELPFYSYRHIVRPGITGWAQVNQGHVAEVDEVQDKLQYDFYYIKFFSAWLDIVIYLRTCRVMFTGHGAR